MTVDGNVIVNPNGGLDRSPWRFKFVHDPEVFISDRNVVVEKWARWGDFGPECWDVIGFPDSAADDYVDGWKQHVTRSGRAVPKYVARAMWEQCFNRTAA